MTAETQDDTERQAESEKFESMFRNLGRLDVQVTDITETTSGRVVRLLLPTSGKVSLRILEMSAAKIEIILRLRPDTVRFAIGEHAADIIMSLNEHVMPGSSIEQAVTERVGRISLLAKAGDDEAARVAEDELYKDALDAIAANAVIDPSALAKAVLTSQKIKFARFAA